MLRLLVRPGQALLHTSVLQCDAFSDHVTFSDDRSSQTLWRGPSVFQSLRSGVSEVLPLPSVSGDFPSHSLDSSLKHETKQNNNRNFFEEWLCDMIFGTVMISHEALDICRVCFTRLMRTFLKLVSGKLHSVPPSRLYAHHPS